MWQAKFAIVDHEVILSTFSRAAFLFPPSLCLFCLASPMMRVPEMISNTDVYPSQRFNLMGCCSMFEFIPEVSCPFTAFRRSANTAAQTTTQTGHCCTACIEQPTNQSAFIESNFLLLREFFTRSAGAVAACL